MTPPATSILLAAANQGPSIVILILPLILIWYFLLIRPQSKERKQQAAMRQNLKKGDKILTQSGIIAKIHALHGDELVLNLDGNARLHMAREAVTRVLEEGQGAPHNASKAQSLEAS